MTERMQRTVDGALGDVDAILFVLAADEHLGGGDRFVAERVFSGGAPVVVALNKVDRLRPAEIAAWTSPFSTSSTSTVSACGISSRTSSSAFSRTSSATRTSSGRSVF